MKNAYEDEEFASKPRECLAFLPCSARAIAAGSVAVSNLENYKNSRISCWVAGDAIDRLSIALQIGMSQTSRGMSARHTASLERPGPTRDQPRRRTVPAKLRGPA